MSKREKTGQKNISGINVKGWKGKRKKVGWRLFEQEQCRSTSEFDKSQGMMGEVYLLFVINTFLILLAARSPVSCIVHWKF